MKLPVAELLRNFLSNEIGVSEFRATLGEWNSTELWDDLTATEAKLMVNYFSNYFDMYAGDTLPKFSWWERFKRDMRGEGNIDLQSLRKGSADLLRALEREQQKQQT